MSNQKNKSFSAAEGKIISGFHIGPKWRYNFYQCLLVLCNMFYYISFQNYEVVIIRQRFCCLLIFIVETGYHRGSSALWPLMGDAVSKSKVTRAPGV